MQLVVMRSFRGMHKVSSWSVSVVVLLCVLDVTFSASKSSNNNKDGAVRVERADDPTIVQLLHVVHKLRSRVDQLATEQLAMALREKRNACSVRFGKDGKDGRDGRDGTDGKDGRDGVPGRHGYPGQRGVAGPYGLRGSPGLSGPPGMPGVTIAIPPAKAERGPPGYPGQKGLMGHRGAPGVGSGGTVYVRWGRTTCPGGASLVYHGRVGNSHYTASGGGATYLCLVNNPRYGRYNDKPQNGGYIYGAEYHVTGFNPFVTQDLTNHDVPCAVCHVMSRGSQLMVPGTYHCPAGWAREYHGYLMTSSHRHRHPSEFICVDVRAETIAGRGKGLDGSLLSTAEGRCGALPCPPYSEYRELTCAVCTK